MYRYVPTPIIAIVTEIMIAIDQTAVSTPAKLDSIIADVVPPMKILLINGNINC